MIIRIWVENEDGDTLIRGKYDNALEAEHSIRGLVEKAMAIQAIRDGKENE